MTEGSEHSSQKRVFGVRSGIKHDPTKYETPTEPIIPSPVKDDGRPSDDGETVITYDDVGLVRSSTTSQRYVDPPVHEQPTVQDQLDDFDDYAQLEEIEARMAAEEAQRVGVSL